MCEPGTLYTFSTPSSRSASATASPACMALRSEIMTAPCDRMADIRVAHCSRWRSVLLRAGDSGGERMIRVIAAAALCVCACAAVAQAFPTKPIRFIVPFPPGGGNDTMARAFGRKMTEGFTQQVVIDNRPGAGGNIGAETAARALPDGYTVFLGGVGSHGINPNLQVKLPYDPIGQRSRPARESTSGRAQLRLVRRRDHRSSIC